MKVSFHGACREVTGSCHLIEGKGFTFLVDCGMFQGQTDSKNKNLEKFDFDPRKIDFVFLTHAHIDHCGRLPKLFKEGFKGLIYSTKVTRDLSEIILLDSIKIHSQDNKQKPEYKIEDIKNIVRHFKTIDYNLKKEINSAIAIRLRDAGHILGSTIFEIWITEDGQSKKIVFSGDLGNAPAPVVKDPEFIEEADVLFIESTYGGRLHEKKEIGRKTFKKVILETILNKSTLIIPVFALERSQEILYEFNKLVENKIIPRVPIFFDSPLAIRATRIYKKYHNLFDTEAKSLIHSGDDIFDFPNLIFTETRDESLKINTSRPPKIILAGSGMCSGGRIPHHLKRHLENRRDHLLIMSFQAQGTLGRELVSKEKDVLIDDRRFAVNLQITTIDSYSAHADHEQLLNWIKKISNLKKIFIVHGEEEQNRALANSINDIKTIIPEYKTKYIV